MGARSSYAHSANDRGERQALVEHLRNVAGIARDLANSFGGSDLAYIAGLWHDVGKADPTWQQRLIECEREERRRIGLDHKSAGARLAIEKGGAAQWAGFLIHAHHGGLKDWHDFVSWLGQTRHLPGPTQALDELRIAMPDLEATGPVVVPDHVRSKRDAELFLRLTYSALVDADSLDTEAHRLAGRTPLRGSPIGLSELWRRYQAFLAKRPSVLDSDVNRIREEVYESCVQAAGEPQGIFRLTVPTGGGKTRSALAFGLRHGIEHGLRRIIVAVPFTTITQQTAGVYREIFEEGYRGHGQVVLEHHSAATEGAGQASGDEDGFSPDAVWRRTASENWDAPIIVTTTVQLFESLFSNRRSKTRKLHNLARSVIILDEAQALPAGLLSPILDVLRQLAQNYNVSVVLSTATQPVFELIGEFREVEACEIVPDSARHFDVLERVRYEWRTDRPRPWSKVADWMREEHSALAIVNTKRHAMELLDALDDPGVLHLSTLLCGAHRTEVLETIRRRLAAGVSCRVVSTQVVEAGVDLDFETVLRAEAPLDAIIQAAGRCNREGLWERGRVIVFSSPDGAIPPGVYRLGRDTARAVLGNFPGSRPDVVEVLRAYFERLAERVDSDEHNIQKLRASLDFTNVANKFRMIPDDTYDVIVCYPEANASAIAHLVAQLLARQRNPRDVLRQLQPHSVSLHQREAERLKARGWIEEVMPRLGRWLGEYDSVRGLAETDPELVI